MKDFFKLKERKTTVRTEILAGFTTFITMAYILAVNPLTLSKVGIPADAVFSATILASVAAMLYCAFFANLPVAYSSSMGANAFFAYTVCMAMGFDYRLALTAVFCEGLLFILLSLFNIREVLLKVIPSFLKSAIVVGIGFFITFIGLKNGGIITANVATFVTLGDVNDSTVLLSLIGLILGVFLLVKNVKGAFLIVVFSVTLMSIIFGVTKVPENFRFVAMPSRPLFFDFLWDHILTFEFFMVFFTFFFMDLFDTMGTLISVVKQTKIVDKKASSSQLKQAFLADAFGTTIGAVLGTSTVGAFVESSAGVAEGGKTGLTALVVAVLFLFSLFLSPLFLLIPPSATAPVLIIVGFLMVKEVANINFKDISTGLPAFLTIAMMPLSFSIAKGIEFGVLSYLVCLIALNKTKRASVFLWILGLIFLFEMFL